MAKALRPDEINALLEEVLPPYHQAVGEIASVWAMFEQRLDQLIWDILGVEPKLGACLTSQLNGPAPRFRVLKSLLELREWKQELRRKLNKLSHDIIEVQEERNRAVHDVVLVGHNSKRVFKRTVATINNKLVYEVVDQSIEQLKDTLKKSKNILKRFNDVQDEIRSFVPILSDDKFDELSRRHGPLTERTLPLNLSKRA